MMLIIAVADTVLTITWVIVTQEFIGVDVMEVVFDILYWYSVFVVYCYKEELQRGADMGQTLPETHPSGDSAGDFQRFV